MPGLVYTFERAAAGHSSATPQHDAINAIAIAAAGHHRIRYEVITEPENPRPMIVIVFPDSSSLDTFAKNLADAVAAWGLRIREVLTAKGDNLPRP